jgi:transcriptional regulator with XRE-family HTH domain
MAANESSNSSGAMLQAARRTAQLTQCQLAIKCGLSVDTIRRLEHSQWTTATSERILSVIQSERLRCR